MWSFSYLKFDKLSSASESVHMFDILQLTGALYEMLCKISVVTEKNVSAGWQNP